MSLIDSLGNANRLGRTTQQVVAPLPAAPAAPDNEAAQAERDKAAEEERKRKRGGEGFFSTNPTGAQGLLAPANVASKSLLGL